MRKVILLTGESIEIVLGKGTVLIDSEGKAKVDAATYGMTYELFFAENDGTRQIGLQSVSATTPAKRPEPNAEEILRYLHLLFESQKVGHAVNMEIDRTLKQYKQAIGLDNNV